MTHKENCVSNCREHLESRHLLHVYNHADFEHYYRKHKGAQGNAYMVGLNAADFMIMNYQPQEEEAFLFQHA